MSEQPYKHFNSEELVLRDYLAADRTVLANERTLLAYGRTMLALLAAGGSFIQFFDSVALEVTGWGLILLGVVVFATGIARFLRMRARIKYVQRTRRLIPPY